MASIGAYLCTCHVGLYQKEENKVKDKKGLGGKMWKPEFHIEAGKGESSKETQERGVGMYGFRKGIL